MIHRCLQKKSKKELSVPGSRHRKLFLTKDMKTKKALKVLKQMRKEYGEVLQDEKILALDKAIKIMKKQVKEKEEDQSKEQDDYER